MCVNCVGHSSIVAEWCECWVEVDVRMCVDQQCCLVIFEVTSTGDILSLTHRLRACVRVCVCVCVRAQNADVISCTHTLCKD